jgi:hypothetical protein
MTATVAHIAAQIAASVAHLLALLPADVLPPPMG